MISEIHLSNGFILSNADLYLEARGRSSPLKNILEEFVGFIPEKMITNKIRYTTTVIERSAASDQFHEIKQFYRQANSKNQPLGYYVSPIEGDKTIFKAVDYYGNEPNPFAHFKNHPALENQQVQDSKSVSKLYNIHTMYGKSREWPKNLQVIGEAVCRLNPVYGHGLTMCTEHVGLLVTNLVSG